MRAWIRELLEAVFPDVTWRWEFDQEIRAAERIINHLGSAMAERQRELTRLKTPATRIPVGDGGRAARISRNAMTNIGKDARGAAASIPKPRMTHMQGAPRAGKQDHQRAEERRQSSAKAVVSFRAAPLPLSNNAIAEMARTMGKVRTTDNPPDTGGAE